MSSSNNRSASTPSNTASHTSPTSPVAPRSRSTSPPSGASRPPSPTTTVASSVAFEVPDPDFPTLSIESDAIDCETRLRATRRDARRCINQAVRELRQSQQDVRRVLEIYTAERREVKELMRRLRDCEEHGQHLQQVIGHHQELIDNLARDRPLANTRRAQRPQVQVQVQVQVQLQLRQHHHHHQRQQAQPQPQPQQQQQATIAGRQQPARKAKWAINYHPGRG